MGRRGRRADGGTRGGMKKRLGAGGQGCGAAEKRGDGGVDGWRDGY